MRPLVSQLAGYCCPVPNPVFLCRIWKILVKQTSCAVFVGEEGVRTPKRNCLETKPALSRYFHLCQKSALVWPWWRRNLSGLLTNFALTLKSSGQSALEGVSVPSSSQTCVCCWLEHLERALPSRGIPPVRKDQQRAAAQRKLHRVNWQSLPFRYVKILVCNEELWSMWNNFLGIFFNILKD